MHFPIRSFFSAGTPPKPDTRFAHVVQDIPPVVSPRIKFQHFRGGKAVFRRSNDIFDGPLYSKGYTDMDDNPVPNAIVDADLEKAAANHNNGGSTINGPGSDDMPIYRYSPGPLAVLIPLMIALVFITGFTLWFLARRRARRLREAQEQGLQATIAADLETGDNHPQTLSPSIPMPEQEPREHERGWIFMRNFRLPKFVRGYRRRSDVRGQEDPDWELDVDDVGNAPPEYASVVEKRNAEAGVMSRQATSSSALSKRALAEREDRERRAHAIETMGRGGGSGLLPTYNDVTADGGQGWTDDELRVDEDDLPGGSRRRSPERNITYQ